MIAGGSLSQAILMGDVYAQDAYSFVRGGNDIIKGGDAPEIIVGDVYSVGDNQMIGGSDLLWGGGGDDVIYGDFAVIGATGKVTAGNDTIFGGAGNDTIYGDGADDAKTTGGDDRLFGEEGDDLIIGGTGNDLLDGGAGNDFLRGGAGNDTYVIDNALDFVFENANEGIDTIRSYFGNVTLEDNFENLTFIGTGTFTGFGNGLDNTIRGGSGADNLNGLAGNDRLHGGVGDDMLFGDNGDDVLNGGSGADQLVGGNGFDTASYAGSEQAVKVSLDGSVTATGDAIGDTFNAIEGLEGTSFNDVLRGDAGNNMLDGGSGADEMFGGAGDDVFVVDSAADSTVEAANGGTDTVRSYVNWVLADNVERLEFQGSGNLNGTGNVLNNTLVGNSGNNLLNGGAGNDYMVGGAGNDIYVVAAAGDKTIEAANGGADTVRSYINWTLADNVERLELQGSGNLNGSGNALNNTLVGNSGRNSLNGGAGNDYLYGGAGNDILTGGAGADRFAFTTALSWTNNIDRITDFNVSEDKIILDSMIFAGLAKGALAAGAFHVGPWAQAADDRIIYNSATGALLFDQDGAGGVASIQFATLSTGLALTADYFLVV